MVKTTYVGVCLTTALLCAFVVSCHSERPEIDNYGQWMKKPPSEWPQITMIKSKFL